MRIVNFAKKNALQYLGNISLHACGFLGQYLILLQRFRGCKVSYKYYSQSAIFNRIMLKKNSDLQFELPSILAHFQVILIEVKFSHLMTWIFYKILNFDNFVKIANFMEFLAVILIGMQFLEFLGITSLWLAKKNFW